MKLNINKKLFLQSWGLAERSTSGSSSMTILSSVLVKASFEEVSLQATDIKTSIICKASGVTVVEPGEAVFPVKIVGDLFKKAQGDEFTLSVSEGKVLLRAGKSKYNFSTYPVSEFPILPSSNAAKVFCKISAKDLTEVLEEGTLAASSGEEFPLFLSSANFQITKGVLRVVSTDTRRLALSETAVTEAEDSDAYLLPMKGIKEVQRILSTMDPSSLVEVLFDEAQFYFRAENVEFAVRRVESRFPPYEKILPKEHATTVIMDRGNLISALDRVDVIVRDYNRMVVIDITPKPNESFVMSGKAPDFGQAVEEMDAEVTGDKLRIAVNSKYFMEALKVMRDPYVKMGFNGSFGHMAVKHTDRDTFLCLVAPINLSEEDLRAEKSETADGDRF